MFFNYVFHASNYCMDDCMKQIYLQISFRIFYDLGFKLIKLSHLGLFMFCVVFRGLQQLFHKYFTIFHFEHKAFLYLHTFPKSDKILNDVLMTIFSSYLGVAEKLARTEPKPDPANPVHTKLGPHAQKTQTFLVPVSGSAPIPITQPDYHLLVPKLQS